MTDDEPGGSRIAPAIAVGTLFAVMAATITGAEFAFDEPGFPADASVVHNIGYAMFDLGAYDVVEIPAEGFLAAFLIAAVALDVAIDGAVYLAKREEDGSIVAAVGRAFTDGGRDGGDER